MIITYFIIYSVKYIFFKFILSTVIPLFRDVLSRKYTNTFRFIHSIAASTANTQQFIEQKQMPYVE